MIAIGAIAPDFTLPRDGGTSLTLSAPARAQGAGAPQVSFAAEEAEEMMIP